MRELVSILTPVRNGGAFLAVCLESIINQTYKNWELLIVDDNSQDDTWETIKQYSESDSRILGFKNQGEGILPALQTAYSHATGTRITRMDADDIMEPDKLELLLESVTTGHVAVGFVNYFSDRGVGEGYKSYAAWLNDLTNLGKNFSDLYKECTIPSSCWMLDRQDFDGCGGIGNVYPEDYDLAFRMKEYGLKVKPVKKVIHQWRDHDSRASRNDDNYKDNRFLDLKVFHFLKQDRNENQGLTLIGAGKKGKIISQLLSKNRVEFCWATNNPRKIGVNIHEKVLISENEIPDNSQLLIGVAGDEGAQLRVKYPNGYFFC